MKFYNCTICPTNPHNTHFLISIMYPTRFWHVIWRDANPGATRFKPNLHKMEIYVVNTL